MDDYYINKQRSFQTTVSFADSAKNRTIWNGQDPKIFTVRYGAARTLVGNLVTFTADLGTNLTGARDDKEAVQKELAAATIALGNAAAEWFHDHQDATSEKQVLFTPSGLLEARDQVPADAAVVVLEKVHAILALPLPTLPDPPQSDYGLTTAAEALEDLLDGYNELINQPATVRKARKGKRQQVPARFVEVEAAFESCDRPSSNFAASRPISSKCVPRKTPLWTAGSSPATWTTAAAATRRLPLHLPAPHRPRPELLAISREWFGL